MTMILILITCIYNCDYTVVDQYDAAADGFDVVVLAIDAFVPGDEDLNFWY